jgi:hypothetical protein
VGSQKIVTGPVIEEILNGIVLISESPRPTIVRVRSLIPNESLVVCDCYVQGSENWNAHPWGYERDGIANVDHHAPDRRWERAISSGNLAVLYAQERGCCPVVMVNHSDCDSVISAGIVTGMLEPRHVYEAAVIAADHSGEENPIADLLQALQDQRNLALSFTCLQMLERGQALPPIAEEQLRHRRAQRERAHRLVRERLDVRGRVACLSIEDKIESELVGPLVPEAWLVAIAFPSPEHRGRIEFKVRLTAQAPAGMSLHRIGMDEVDPAFGSRWNAGSNKRRGCTDIPIEELFDRLERNVREYQGQQ